jgi:A/G-specific adenine glycosylase
LPWRDERDPYRVLVSEVMLQQTQASRVIGPYAAFLARFPTAARLAEAGPGEVLRAWGSLGYNRRALALWRAAVRITEGGFPRTVAELEMLAGVGPYTARAIASFAFGLDVGVVDANVRRVLTRLYGMDPTADVQALADRLVPRSRSAMWNQAMIDLGAVVCRARRPTCHLCPLERSCRWAVGERPGAEQRAPAPAFATTSRYARGRVVAALRRSKRAIGLRELRLDAGLNVKRFAGAVRDLERDGIIAVRGERVVLGASDGASVARPRR